jgi:hypothetical protein
VPFQRRKHRRSRGQRIRHRRTHSRLPFAVVSCPPAFAAAVHLPLPSPSASSLSEAEGQPTVTGCGKPASTSNGQAHVLVRGLPPDQRRVLADSHLHAGSKRLHAGCSCRSPSFSACCESGSRSPTVATLISTATLHTCTSTPTTYCSPSFSPPTASRHAIGEQTAGRRPVGGHAGGWRRLTAVGARSRLGSL